MSSTPTGGLEDELWEMETDLSSLANQAAIELDNYILGRHTGFQAIKRLASRLASDVANGDPASKAVPYDPITISVVNRAIDELVGDPVKRPNKISDVVEYASKLAQRLADVAENPHLESAQQLAQLRDSCVVLSENASASGRPLHEDAPQHPYRR